jgi:signal transduction histidine kinase/CheY-like chemotaxis protein
MARRGMSIRTKLIAISTLLMVGVIGLFSTMHTVSHLRIIDDSSRRMQDSLVSRLRLAGLAQLKLMAEVTRLALLQSDFITLQTIVRNVAREQGITAVAVVDRKGRVLAHGRSEAVGTHASGMLRRAVSAREVTVRTDQQVAGTRSMTFVEPVRLDGDRIGTVFVAYSLRPLAAELAKTAETKARELRSGLQRTVLAGLLALTLGVILIVLQSLRLSRPIQELARQADKMAGGDLDVRVPIRSGDEIGRLSERFNYMAEQMQVLVQEAISKATMEKELELAEASRLAAVGRLAAGVAHEVNNPLTYAKGNLQMLARELEGDEELFELAQEALHGVGRIQNVVRQLSEFARSRQRSLPGRVQEAVSSAAKMAMVQLKDRATLVVEVPDLPQVTMEESKLAQVVLNLFVNSAQAIPAGSVEENWVRVGAQKVGEAVEITVEDSGPGIPADVLPHIFESFFTTKDVGKGYGLGLSVSRSLVERAGGEIEVENKPGGGARFTVRLPLHVPDELEQEEEQARAIPAPAPAGQPRRSLLLVDDDPEVLKSLARMLDPAFDVTTATSGTQALDALEARERFDVILCDIMMPETSGLEVLDVLEEEQPELLPRVFLMTGGTPGVEREARARARDVPILGKPFDLNDLLRLLDERENACAETGESPTVASGTAG